MTIDVRTNCFRTFDKITAAAARCGRNPTSVKLIAVTKTVSPEHIRQAIECGIREIGESRIQEAIPKMDALADLNLTWHFIGHLQTNKAKKAVEHFDYIQCVDRPELAEKLNQAASSLLPVLIEVKLHEEAHKSGIAEESLPPFVEQFGGYAQLQLRGLMAIPPFFQNPEAARPYFRRLRELSQRLGLPEVSMGMSHDFEIAIEEGATMVRIGTALFGGRS